MPVVPVVPVVLTVNGVPHDLELDPRTTVLDALREHLGLTGSKKGCDRGQCGACTVLLDGRRVNSCLVLAVSVAGREITTVEGLASSSSAGPASPDGLHPVQQAFLDHDAFQCGYCTPGQLCSAVGVIAEAAAGWPSAATRDVRDRPGLDEDEVRERMSGNLCRCAAYVNIVPAVMQAALAAGSTNESTNGSTNGSADR